MRTGTGEQSFRWFVERLKAEEKAPIMHRHQGLPAQFQKRRDGLLRVHVHFATGRRLVSADRKQGDLDLVTVADFLEAGKISAVAAMKHCTAIPRDDEAAKGTM